MNDETKNEGDEYQYSADQYADVYGTGEGDSLRVHPGRRIFAILTFVVMIFIGYKLVTIFLAKRTKSTQAKSSVTRTVKAPIQVAPPALSTVPTTPVAVTPVTTMQPVESSSVSTDDSTDKITSRLSETNEQINQINLSIKNLNDKLADITGVLDQVSDNVQALSSTVKEHFKKPPPPKPPVVKKRKARRVVRRRRPPVVVQRARFYVQALVPGRAWLESSEGATITVTVGDQVPGYGVVRGIDLNRGVVVTSTGAVFGYSAGS